MPAHPIGDWTVEKTIAKPFRLRGLLSALLREIRIRRALREVAAFDDTTLSDIGVGRSGIEDAVRYGRR